MSTYSLCRVSCTHCETASLCGTAEMLARLQAIGILRREKEPAADLVYELFTSAATRLRCHACGEAGMHISPWQDDFDDRDTAPQRLCEACGEPIPRERIEALPDTRCCVACQHSDDRGQSSEAPDYCPRCGAVMEMRLQQNRGLSRYRMTCPACGTR